MAQHCHPIPSQSHRRWEEQPDRRRRRTRGRRFHHHSQAPVNSSAARSGSNPAACAMLHPGRVDMYLQAKLRLFLKQLVGHAARPPACGHAHVGDRGNARSAKHKSSTHALHSDRTKALLPRAPAERKRSTITVTVCAVCPKAQLLRAAPESEEK